MDTISQEAGREERIGETPKDKLIEKYVGLDIGETSDELVIDDEEEGATAMEENRAAEFPVVGMLLTDKVVRFQIFNDLMAALWHPGKGVSIKEIDEKRYLIKKIHYVDMNHVLDNRPWLFDQNLLVLRAIKPGDIPLKVSLDSVEFWVQVHNVSYNYANLGVARRIENYLGKFVRWDDNEFDKKNGRLTCG
ncbi:unnamed protein product [Cuscuta europaea]|uniref:DUF4283 domain-containing protein n=1 Tax=Cuscuta europaea TaxID=41803 RepID=A0A9P0YQ97_CUSEU|nr:unnamed protein product [Cuscuta europaea]